MTRTLLSLVLLGALVAPAPALAQPAAPTPSAPTAAAPTAPKAAAPTAPATAAPVARLSPPIGWVADDTRAGAQVRMLAAEPHFAGASLGIDAQYLAAPTPGAILIISQIVTEALPADPAAAATAELHAARDGADAVDGAKIVTWKVTVDPAQHVHEALLEWTDPSVGTTVVSRTLVFRVNADLARISAECILGPDAGALRAACETAMKTLAPTSTVFQPLAVSATAPVAGIEPAPSMATPSPGAPPAPTIGDRADGLPSTIMVKPPVKQPDRRPFYVLGGLAILGAAWWWNRRERDRRAAENAAAGKPAAGKPDRDEPDDKDES